MSTKLQFLPLNLCLKWLGLNYSLNVKIFKEAELSKLEVHVIVFYRVRVSHFVLIQAEIMDHV